jgi:hypothetical protein
LDGYDDFPFVLSVSRNPDLALSSETQIRIV